jgi:glycogen debranching enzyme
VLHDAQDRPTGIMRSESGENMNKGFDGLYPLIAGACTEQQKRILLGHISSPEEIFSPVGLSAVDMTSSYYIADGYWNGSVWFSHQWFFYKTMLDLGKTELAYRIAATRAEDMEKGS